MSDEVRVDPVVLDVTARAAAAVRESLRGEVTDVEPETTQAARELGGWLTGRSMEQLLWSWRDELGRLASQLDGVADGLTACARDYRYADRASADHFRAAA